MKLWFPALLLLLGCATLVLSQSTNQPSGATSDPVTILSVQTALGAASSSLEGSQQGGTALYISGVGFDPSSSNDQVFVGTYPCLISLKGAAQDKITCDTTAPTGTALSGLPISVIVAGKTPFTSTAFKFSYTSGSTPYLAAVYPRSAAGNEQVKFYGVHRITNLGNSANGLDMGDIRGLSIGSSLCNRFNTVEDPINANDWQFITCSIAPDQDGGYYNVTEWVTPGYASQAPRMLYGSISQNLTYQFIVVPEINSLSSHTGGTAGQTLTIGGTGFSIDSSKIAVKVAGMPCTVQSSSAYEVVCQVAASPPGNKFGLLQSTSNSQLNGFISGSGLSYSRYDVTNLSPMNTAGFRAAIASSSASIVLVESGIKSDIQTPNIYAYNYGQVFKGYFVAPTAGNYVFRGLADDLLSMYMSNVTGSTEISYTTPLIESTSYSQSSSADNYYYIGYAGLTSAPVTLAAGEARYIEVYHLNTGGGGNLLVSVEVPNTLTNLPNQVSEVQRVSIVPTVDPEILTWTQTGATSGTMTFQLIRKSGLTVSYNNTKVLKWNATTTEFYNALNTFDLFNGYNAAITLQKYDASGNLITTGTPYKFVWTATIYKYRDPSKTSQTINLLGAGLISSDPAVTPTISFASVQAHSPPVSGTYTLSLGNYLLSYYDSAGTIQSNIPFSSSASQLQSWMAAAWNCPAIEVINAPVSISVDGNSYIISFIGCNGNQPLIVSNNAFLQGGKSGTTPAVTVTEIRAGSSNLLVQPISVEFLRTSASLPQVVVSVGGSVSKCGGDCSYQVVPASTPILNSAILNPVNSQITLNISDPGNIGFSLDQINVTLDGVRCRINTGYVIGNFNCTLDKNPDGSPLVRAGTYIPLAEIENVGFATPIASFTNITVSLVITSLTATTSGLSGGVPIGILGHGFPFSLTETPFTVTMCNKLALVKTVSNTQIGIVAPPCTAAEAATSIVVAYKGISSNIGFNYDPNIICPNISSITPTSASPVLKGTMTITGVGFGSTLGDLTVYLVNNIGVKTYQMNVLSGNDTSLVVKIPGGLSGTFTVTVTRAGFGDSVETTTGAAQFKYEIVVTSISPSTGSANGGTILTITGRNFCPLVENNQVYVGDAINWNCQILTASSTQITCITPPKSEQYTSNSQTVVVVGRAMIDSTCEVNSNCNFTYDNSTALPTVQVPASLNFVSGTSYVLSGTAFINNSVPPKVKVGSVYAQVVSSTATSLTFIYPSLVAGDYPLNVYVDGIGYATPTITSTTVLNVTGLSNSTGSVIGNIVYLVGNGLVPSTTPGFKLTIMRSTASYPYTIVSDTPNQLGVKFMGGVNNYVYTFTYSYGNLSFAYNYTTLTASTPKINVLNGASVAYSSSLVLNLTRVNFISSTPTNITAIPLTPTGAQFAPEIKLTILSSNPSSGNIQANIATLGSGKYNFTVYMPVYGYATINSSLEIQALATTASSVVSAYQGGKLLTVSGNGLNPVSTLLIAGAPATLVSSSPTTLIYATPPYVTSQSQTQYNLVTPGILRGTPFADTASRANYAFDGTMSTKYSSSASPCYVGLDFGAVLRADISRIRYYPDATWTSAAAHLIGATFSASVDNVNWDVLFTVDSTVHTGYNIWRPAAPLTTYYRYVRFQHNSTSTCNIAEFDVYGILYSSTSKSLASNLADAFFNDGFHNVTWTGKVEYRADATSIVTSISPTTASPVGGTNITIVGTGFGTSVADVTVVVDSVPCVVQITTDTQIVCTVGARPALPTVSNFDVRIGGNYASKTCANFTYAFRWSDPATWGGDIPPIDGDTVYVPKGMVLLVDQSTPNLKIIIVEGSIVFADEQEMMIETGSIIVNGGVFTAGTELKPYKNLLTFTLHGSYYDKQLPGFGNKAIGCHCCKFDMYGTPRTRTWTELAATANAGDTSITLMDPTDWQAGEVIVIASTSTDHYESERVTITTYDNTTGVLTFDTPLLHKHLSVVETFGSDSIPMRAEVGLLTRNILVTGDSDSYNNKYGAHIMMHGSSEDGLVGHIAYTEVTQCGQPAIVGRYCMHFHMNGDVSDSYVIGNSVHDSYARILTLHGVHFLTVEWNVGHMVKGHNFFLEDGIETHNVIQHNLAISTIQVWNMLQTDISSASFWITNPLNTLRYNRAAGSDFYGIWYEVKNHPDGVSATSDICPQGLPLGESHDNIAHSNVRFGLRIFVLHSSTYPCQDYRDDSQLDPWASNPSIQNVFYNYVLYRNGEAGLLAEQMGNTIFRNLTIADSGKAGMQFHLTNFSKEFVVVQDSIIIGKTLNNGLPDADLSGTFGVITPRTDGFKVSGLKLINFPAATTAWQSCSVCDMIKVTSGKAAFFEKITYTNFSGNYLHWNGDRRNIFYDIDGTLSGANFNGSTPRVNSAIVPYFPHLDVAGKCFNNTNSLLWNTSLICDNTTTVRNVMFTNTISFDLFENQPIKFYALNAFDQNISALTTGFSLQKFAMPKKDKKNAWAAPFLVDNMYDVWWNEGIDWTSTAVVPSIYFTDLDKALIVRYNYTETRQLFEITKLVGGSLQLPYISPQSGQLDTATCNAGDYYHDPTNRYLYVCVSGRQKPITTYINLNGIKCRYLCPKPAGEFVKEPFIRQWSNVTQWPNATLPPPGANVTVNGNWTIMMDVDPAPMEFLTIDGDVLVQARDTTITANSIWIRAGSLTAGNSSAPFNNSLTITLNGNRTDAGYIIDPTVGGKKFLVVTGNLSLFGQPPKTVWTALTSRASPGDTSINVASTTDWVVGDELVIGPTFHNPNETERITITALTSTSVTFTPALNFTHYGDSVPISNTYGTLDTRAAVGHITRNIKIVAGTDPNYGFHVLSYGMIDGNRTRIGSATLKGVEFVRGGQQDTDSAAFHVLSNPNNVTTLVDSCSFVDSSGFSMMLDSSANVTVNNNVFFKGYKFVVSVDGMQDYRFTNNLMINARVRPNMDGENVACYIQYKPVDFTTDNNLVTNNLCQGSHLHGFILPFTPCQFLGQTNVGFFGNTAGSCVIGTLYNVVPGACIGGQGVKGYANRIGFIAHPPGPMNLVYQNFMLADNGRSMGLRHGYGGYNGDNNTAVWKDSWVSAVSRPSCSYCYGSTAIDCVNNHALRMMVTTINGQALPKFGEGFDTICQHEALDSKAFLVNVTFDNFRQTYTGAISSCKNNVVFIPHPLAHDLTGSHHLTQTSCVNCQQNSWARFTAPDDSELGWFGGCGLLYCTGRNNYIVQDHDGSFMGSPGTLLANNSWIGDNQPSCVYNPTINGYVCSQTDFAVLEYESIAPDFNTRIMWPVNLSYWGGNWTSVTNGYREWDWNGREPNNKRLGRFISTVRLGQVYNMTFSAQPPSDMRFQIQRRTQSGNSSDWVAIRIYYPVANAISVLVNNAISNNSILATSSEDVTDRRTVCGANKYFYQNGTISFIVTGDMKCQVRVLLTSNVQITSRLMVPMNTFFSNNGVATFIDKMCAFLNITTDRLKVVGVTSGSTLLDWYLVQAIATTPDNSTTTITNLTEVRADLTTLMERLQSAPANSIDLGGTLGPIAGSTAQLTIVNTDGSVYQQPVPSPPATIDSNKTTIIVAVVVSVLSLSLVGVTSYLVVKKLRLRERIEPEESEERGNDDVQIHQEKQAAIRNTTLEIREKELTDNKSSLNIIP